jgi:hypothetical protein
MHYRSEEHKIEYLRSAVIGMSWAREPLSRVNAGYMSYQELFSQLESSIQQERDEKAAILQDANYSRSGSRMSDKVPGIFFNGQARYGRENTRKYSPANAVQSNGKECWNCGSPNHLLGGCTKKKDIANIAARKVQFYNKTKFDDENKALKRVLFEICEQIRTDDNDTGGYEDATTYFQECSVPESEIPNDETETENGLTMEQLFNHPTESQKTEPSLTNCLSDF